MHAHIQGTEALRLATLTSAEFDAARQQTPGVIIPIGSIEQHGAIGLLGCDALGFSHANASNAYKVDPAIKCS